MVAETCESEAALDARCRAFRDRLIATDDWREVLVVSHWGSSEA